MDRPVTQAQLENWKNDLVHVLQKTLKRDREEFVERIEGRMRKHEEKFKESQAEVKAELIGAINDKSTYIKSADKLPHPMVRCEHTLPKLTRT